ncbi:MAG: hypothetical protein K2K64_12440 [Muribaculaceae bacterium]|nr:hypothetical protein [Muribaculaceae bacterium]
MDKIRLNELLDRVYELEGLIHLALNRDDNTEYLMELISRKGKLVGEAASFAPADIAEGKMVNEEVIKEEEPVKEEIRQVEDTQDEEPEILAPFGAVEDVPEYSEDEPAPDEEATLVATVDVPLEKIESPLERDIILDGLAGAEEKALEEIVGDIAKESIAAAPKTEPNRTEMRGRLVFTLNDKFRFKRELFGNSDAEFNNTLAYVASLDSYPEAEDYFLTDLQWNPKREEVKDFLEILKKYYK